MPALLDVRELSVQFFDSRTPAIRNATFSIDAGEIVLLVGPSGSGKSTLATALNGAAQQILGANVTGTVIVDGVDVGQRAVAQNSELVAFVGQDADAQIVTGNVWDEVCFGPENLSLPIDEIERRAEHALERVGLLHKRNDAPATLSGGERQRLAIAAAIAMQPKLLVLDEPTANLDGPSQREVHQLLCDVASTGTAVLVIDHNVDVARSSATRVLVLDQHGTLVFDDGWDQLRSALPTLQQLGVWLPAVTTAALHLQANGTKVRTLPLDADELRAELKRLPVPERRPARSLPGAAAITLSGLAIDRGDCSVLRMLNASVTSGEFVAVIGANGSGKTTLLLTIAGLLKSPRGSVSVLGVDPARASRRDLDVRVGFVFQNPEHQFVTTNVRDEIALGLKSSGLSATAQTRRVDELLERLGLTEHQERHPFTLSGGQKRRLSVATALANSANVLVLDEPTFGQDYERAEELATLLAELNSNGVTIVLATHDLQLAADYADRVLVLFDGAVIAAGPFSTVRASGALARAGLSDPPLAEALSPLDGWNQFSSVRRMQ